MDNILLRGLRPDQLPSRCFSIEPHTGTNSSPSGISSNKQRTDKMTLKKLDLTGEQRIVIEILEDKMINQLQEPGVVRVWVQRLLNPENTIEGKSVMSPTWPPLQVC
jgi:hypothetical protein